MLAEFGGEGKHMPTRDKGLFFQDKTAEAGTVRDKMPHYPAKCGNRSDQAGSSSQWRTTSPRAASTANTPAASTGAPPVGFARAPTRCGTTQGNAPTVPSACPQAP